MGSSISWDSRFARRATRITSSTIRELLKMAQQPGMITFSGGLPAPELFPAEAMAEASARILREKANQALQYSTTEGYPALREWVAAQLPNTQPDQVLLVSGSQQGLDLLGKIFIDAGSAVAVESPTYMGALSAFNPYEPEYLTVAMDEEGMVPEALEAVLKQGPRFVYALPTFQNPSGRLMSLERRQKLVELADKYGVPIVEDDAYAELYYGGQKLPTLYSLDQQMRGGGEGNVIYLSTFSKTLAPGLRVAYAAGPRPVIHKLVQAKQGADLHTGSLNQMLVYEMVKYGLQEQLSKIRETYAARRDVMLEAMAQHLPKGVTWNQPKGGMFIWMQLPQGADAVSLFKKALEQKVAFVPGQPFHADGSGQNTLRLSFSNADPELIREGIRRLGRAAEEELELVK
ncbi:PLP-dependent aminotransferase family protein [Calidithermus chliarophilus]|uniref:aminotransferase-like domain-containing protein n=1 Tax=Calidithermus chliarophilus TaxID=52023 RepID=UPI00040791D9|nr:PLP-dependent aminotransferase family protein [Calidithermus chliarophilus]